MLIVKILKYLMFTFVSLVILIVLAIVGLIYYPTLHVWLTPNDQRLCLDRRPPENVPFRFQDYGLYDEPQAVQDLEMLHPVATPVEDLFNTLRNAGAEIQTNKTDPHMYRPSQAGAFCKAYNNLYSHSYFIYIEYDQNKKITDIRAEFAKSIK